MVDLEDERPLDAHALEPGDARGERRVAVRADVPFDVLDLALARVRVPGSDEVAQVRGNGWPGQVDALEQPVDGVAELGGMQREPAAVSVRPLPRRRPHADDPLRVVAV